MEVNWDKVVIKCKKGNGNMKVFISQPMNGKSEVDIEKSRSMAVIRLKREFKERFENEDLEIINTFIKDAPENVHPIWYLQEMIKYMQEADIFLFIEDWYGYRGCKAEWYIVNSYFDASNIYVQFGKLAKIEQLHHYICK